VRDVLQAARKQTEAVHPICVPTVLDHEFTAYFLPAPRQLPYGRTLQLMGDPECEHKIAEVLHLRFVYKPEHIHKVGVVTEPVTAPAQSGARFPARGPSLLPKIREWPGRFRPIAHRMDRSMTIPLETSHTPAWLERFRVEPKAALDAMLRGLARVPPYERAAPPDILDRLFGGLPADDPDLCLLDETLRGWLADRHMAMGPERHAEYGLSRCVTETMGALSTIWLLDLPRSGAWIQDNFLELTRRAAPLRLSEAWDLPRALAQAAALTQTDQRLPFLLAASVQGRRASLPAGYDRLGPEWPEQPTGHQGPWRGP